MNINGTKYYELKAYVHNVIQSLNQEVKRNEKESFTSFVADDKFMAYSDILRDLKEINKMLIKLEEVK